MENLNDLWKDEESSIRNQLLRNFKLYKIREMRAPLLEASDIMSKDVALGIRADKENVKTYVLTLRNFTESFKSEDDSNEGTEALDEIDLENIVWPIKP